MGTYWNFNPPLAQALAESRIDISIGSVLILVGFVMQLMHNLDYYFHASVGQSTLIGVAIFVITYWTFLRRLLANRLFQSALERNRKQQEKAAEEAAD